LTDETGQLSLAENIIWIKENCISFPVFARALDSELWHESEGMAQALEIHAYNILRGITYELGGGGADPFLYFLTRYLRPQCIVETAVGAGYSSSAFLSALRDNGKGRLYSSDFPYFRLPQPEKFIGVAVAERPMGAFHRRR
jgi:hypothetical protein